MEKKVEIETLQLKSAAQFSTIVFRGTVSGIFYEKSLEFDGKEKLGDHEDIIVKVNTKTPIVLTLRHFLDENNNLDKFEIGEYYYFVVEYFGSLLSDQMLLISTAIKVSNVIHNIKEKI